MHFELNNILTRDRQNVQHYRAETGSMILTPLKKHLRNYSTTFDFKEECPKTFSNPPESISVLSDFQLNRPG